MIIHWNFTSIALVIVVQIHDVNVNISVEVRILCFTVENYSYLVCFCPKLWWDFPHKFKSLPLIFLGKLFKDLIITPTFAFNSMTKKWNWDEYVRFDHRFRDSRPTNPQIDDCVLWVMGTSEAGLCGYAVGQKVTWDAGQHLCLHCFHSLIILSFTDFLINIKVCLIILI